MSIISKIDDLIRRYEKNPILRGLVQLVPFASSVETTIFTTVQNIRIERLRTFFDELAIGTIELTPDLLESEDFLHAYFSTLKAATNSRRREKIRMFARFFRNSYKSEFLKSTDDFEELLNILDELSYREILTLCKLHVYECNYRNSEDKTGWDSAKLFWDLYISSIVDDLGVRREEVFDYLCRLERTGCYEEYDTFFGNDKRLGHLTPIFYRLIDLLEVNDIEKWDDIR